MSNKFLYESKEFISNRADNKFKLISDFAPHGDQPRAIAELVEGIERNDRHQTLLGVTGSGKTFTMANIIARTGRTALVMAPNKTLAAQLYNEFKTLFPENAVEYFVSYYDYYQPEAYMPQSDTYIEKDSSINEEIDRLRHSATHSLLTRNDCIIVSSVSCIYGLGAADAYYGMVIHLEQGRSYNRERILRGLVDILYDRNDLDFHRGTFRVRGDRVEIFPPYEDKVAVRLDFFGDELEKISEIDPLRGNVLKSFDKTTIFPGSHYVADEKAMAKATTRIEAELNERIRYFKDNNMLIEAQRIEQRTSQDVELIQQMGFCSGIENYSRQIEGRAEGEPPATLLDYFPPNFILFADESHMTIPQIDGMYKGDRSRKNTLVDYGFRLPSALDNRPLKFNEFNERVSLAVYVSATPADYEMDKSEGVVVEQIIRPTGLIDPEVIIRPATGQVDDLLDEINQIIERGERILVTTLTKRMSEELTSYLEELGVKVKYLHSDIDTVTRMEIILDLRRGVIDVLVGINLLREGLDIPEVSLVAILDADKEGFLRSARSLIQTIGRASRNASGRVILYADTETKSIKQAVEETARRRELQKKHNIENNITPKSIKKNIQSMGISGILTDYNGPALEGEDAALELMPPEKIIQKIDKLSEKMKKAADDLLYEKAATIRDEIRALRKKLLEM